MEKEYGKKESERMKKGKKEKETKESVKGEMATNQQGIRYSISLKYWKYN